MKNEDYRYSISKIRRKILKIFEERGVKEEVWVVTDLCHLIAREKKKSFGDGYDSAIESSNDEFEKGVIKGRLEAMPITKKLVEEAEERGFKEGYKRAYEASFETKGKANRIKKLNIPTTPKNFRFGYTSEGVTLDLKGVAEKLNEIIDVVNG